MKNIKQLMNIELMVLNNSDRKAEYSIESKTLMIGELIYSKVDI